MGDEIAKIAEQGKLAARHRQLHRAAACLPRDFARRLCPATNIEPAGVHKRHRASGATPDMKPADPLPRRRSSVRPCGRCRSRRCSRFSPRCSAPLSGGTPGIFDRLGEHAEKRFGIDPTDLPFAFVLEPRPMRRAHDRGAPASGRRTRRADRRARCSALIGLADGTLRRRRAVLLARHLRRGRRRGGRCASERD